MPEYLFQRIGVLDEITVTADTPEQAETLIQKVGIKGKGGEFKSTLITQVVTDNSGYKQETTRDILGEKKK